MIDLTNIVLGLSVFGGKLARGIVPPSLRPNGYLVRLTQARTGCRVRSGIFEGMHYVSKAVGSAYIPKLLGIYERELAAPVEEICQKKPRLILDVGAAEGYYAIGLARRNPQAQIIAFEMEESGRQLLKEMAELNQVEARVEIRGKCEPQDLQAALHDATDPVLVCDVEGYEEQLLDPIAIPELQRVSILVELHELLRPGIKVKLQKRFAPTHKITCIEEEPRLRSEFPWRTLGTTLLPNFYLDRAVSEMRDEAHMNWLWMTPL